MLRQFYELFSGGGATSRPILTLIKRKKLSRVIRLILQDAFPDLSNTFLLGFQSLLLQFFVVSMNNTKVNNPVAIWNEKVCQTSLNCKF